MGVGLGLLAGASKVGLPFEHPSLSTVFRVRAADWVYLGLGPEFGAMFINRVTSGDTPFGVSIGFFLEATVDLWRGSERGALSLVTRVSYDYIDSNARGATVTA